MKRNLAVCSILIVIALIAGLMAGCEDPFSGGDEPNLIISLAGVDAAVANTRFAYPPSNEDLALMRAELVLTREGAEYGTTYEFAGNQAFSIRLSPGRYTLSLSLFYMNGADYVPLARTDDNDPNNTFTVEENQVVRKNVIVYRQFMVSGVTVTPINAKIAPGGERQFFVTVTLDRELLPQDVTWTVTGQESAGTSISAGGILTVDPDETAVSLTVTATSTLDRTMSGSVTVSVSADGPIEVSLTGIEIESLPEKRVYEIGEELDLMGMVVIATFSDGSTANVTGYVGMSGFDSETVGDKIVTVTFEDETATFKVTVKPPTLVSIAVTRMPAKTAYLIGEPLDLTGMVVTATYSSGSPVEVEVEECTLIYDPFITGGIKTVTIYYEDETTTFEVTVNNRVFDVSSAGEWADAVSAINELGNGAADVRKAYAINIIQSFRIDGISAGAATFTPAYIDINLNGNGNTISLNSSGSLLNIDENQVVTMDRLALRGRTGNNASLVFIYSGGTLTMNGGEVSGNTASYGSGLLSNGGGVSNYGTFTMNGGTVSANTASGDGGGVYSFYGTFTMNGGEVSGNTAYDSGGGVYMDGGIFRISNGIVYGSNERDQALRNTASSGAALYKGTAEYGTFGNPNDTRTWNGTAIPMTGSTSYRNGTIRVQSGVFVIPPITSIYSHEHWDAAINSINDWGDGTANDRKTYTLNIIGSFGLNGVTASTFTRSHIDITINGNDHTISLNYDSTGSLLRIGGAQTVTMDRLTLKGHATNTSSLVEIFSSDSYGYYSDAIFTMNSGEISGNTTTMSGGGVYVSGTFIMNGGEISNNTTSGHGGGVCNYGTFIMNGGKISHNTVADPSNSYARNGGGVYVHGTFTMTGGEISGNSAKTFGGGVHISTDGAGSSQRFFTMNGGTVSGNTAASGGGVFVDARDTFTMNGGTVSGNTASSGNGGGVYVGSDGIFIMNDGTVSGNTASSGNGGGVYVGIANNGQYFGIFRTVSGTIYGSNETDENLRNTATNGAALYKNVGSIGGAETQYGTFSGPDNTGTWNGTAIPLTGTSTRNTTIRVVNGVVLSTFTVSSTAEWVSAVSVINEEGSGAANVRKAYTIDITGSFGVNGTTSSTFTPTYTDIVINGNNHNINLNSSGNLLRLGSYQSVTMDSLTLKGYTSNNNSVVYITGTTAVLTMNNCTVSGNTNSGNGGGVYLNSGTFTMNGGTVTGNTGSNGGGVYLNSGTFTMNGGTVTGNTGSNGGGVYVNSGTSFTMNRGTVTDNKASGTGNTSSNGNGGGVYVGGTFNMNSGEVSDNTASSTSTSTSTSYICGSGGGVYVGTNAAFTMKDGTVSGNRASSSSSSYGNGGGVYLSSSGTFTMTNGTVSGNTGSSGGGVYISSSSSSIFRIVNGTVYGSDNPALRNAASSGTTGGAALYKGSSGIAEYGTFSGPDNTGTWNGISVTSTTTRNTTISVDNGLIVVPSTFTVSSTAEWASAVSVINEAGSGATNARKTYTINVNENFGINGTTSNIFTPTFTDIVLNGIAINGESKTISLNSNGNLLRLGTANQTVTMNGLTLAGREGNNNSVVRIDGTSFTMNSEARVTGNTNSSNGGGVYLASGAFTMNGGSVISGNTAASGGGGVYVGGGTFRIVNGTIYGSNESMAALQNNASNSGAALYIASGTAQYGTFSGTEWASAGSLSTTPVTIRVQNGALGISSSYTVSSASEWTTAVASVNLAGDGTADARKAYTITVSGNFELGGITASTFSRTFIDITLNGTGTITLNSNGSLLRLGANQSVTMGGITLRGRTDNTTNNTALVYIDGANAAFTMNSGAKVTGNTASGSYGAGVYVNNGTFTMSGGEVSGNTATANGGGVYVNSANGTFIMNSGAKVTSNAANGSSSNGGGVYVSGGTFTMSGGEVSGNTASGSNGGGGVYVSGSGTFTMNGGTVSGNTASGSSGSGAGVYVSGGTFTMSGGEISDNTANGSSSYGGGVCVSNSTSSIFRIVNGTIYGSGEGDKSNKTPSSTTNTVALYKGASGIAQYGTFSGTDWVSAGSLSSTNVTVRVQSGALVLSSSYTVSSLSEWNAALAAITLAGDGTATARKAYTITVSGNIELGGTTANTFTPAFIDITLNGTGTIGLSSTGSLIRIGANQSVTMGGLTLTGRTGNNTALVFIDGASASFTMNTGAKVTGNTASGNYSAGVYVGSGTFTMTGGEVTGNTGSGSYGAGVYVSGSSATFTMSGTAKVTSNMGSYGTGVYINNGTFTMTGGEVSLNTASSSSGGVYVSGSSGTFTMSGTAKVTSNTSSASSNAAGVYVASSGTFTMNGGEVSGNTASSTSGIGGVYVNGGIFTMNNGAKVSNNTTAGSGAGVSITGSSTRFTMSGGEVSGNAASNTSTSYGSGGGVIIASSATFTMSGTAKVSDNTASTNGGGVYNNGGTFTMNSGTLSGNKASNTNTSYGNGGGVYLGSGTFTMNGGEMSGNTASGSGGGVYVNNNASYIFRISNGTVYGSEAAETLRNTATNGAALYKNANGIAQFGVFSNPDNTGDWDGMAIPLSGTSTTNRNETIRVENGLLGGIRISAISAPTWREGNPFTLSAPTVLLSAGQTASEQGWQTSTSNTSGFADYTPPSLAVTSDNNKYLRYYAVSGGQTYYSNVVQITVQSAIAAVAAQTWREGNVISLTPPSVVLPDITAQGWQISATTSGTSAYSEFSASRADISDHNKYLRYYAVSGGQTYYSATGRITVNSAFGSITAPTWQDYGAISFAVPSILTEATLSTQGWQTSDTNTTTSVWTEYTLPALADISDHNKYIRYYATSGSQTFYSNVVRITVNPVVIDIAVPVWSDGSAISLAAPSFTPAGATITVQGWQISDNGTSGWTNFTPPATADMSYHNKYLRYTATTGRGSTVNSSVVRVTVISATARPVTIDMYDSYGDGWNSSGALRITVNGTQTATGIKVSTNTSENRSFNTYSFGVEAGDVVELHWVAGSSQSENSFIVYYTDTPPDPAFTSSNNNTWSGSNALVFRLRGGMNSIANDALLGSFTVP